MSPLPYEPHGLDPQSLIPAGFAAAAVDYDAEGYVDGDTFVLGLPRTLASLLTDWELEVTGHAMWGWTAMVLPVRGREGTACLKVCFPSLESDTEHLALRHWGGDGAVRLLRADPARFALLLEALGRVDLRRVQIDEACQIIGGLLTRLGRPAIPSLHRLSDRCEEMRETLSSAPDVLPPRYLDQARQLLSELAKSPTLDAQIIHTDLHFENVLNGLREPWLAIDPKPLAGEQAFEVAPALWNRTDELGSGSEIRTSLRRRLEIICESAQIDEGRARAWAIVRVALNAIWAAGQPGSREETSLAVAIIKAMND